MLIQTLADFLLFALSRHFVASLFCFTFLFTGSLSTLYCLRQVLFSQNYVLLQKTYDEMK